MLTFKSSLYFGDNFPLSAMSFTNTLYHFVAYFHILLSNELLQSSTPGFVNLCKSPAFSELQFSPLSQVSDTEPPLTEAAE